MSKIKDCGVLSKWDGNEKIRSGLKLLTRRKVEGLIGGLSIVKKIVYC